MIACLPCGPDPAPIAALVHRKAHVVVPYTVTFRDTRTGKWWRCHYPVIGPRTCSRVNR